MPQTPDITKEIEIEHVIPTGGKTHSKTDIRVRRSEATKLYFKRWKLKDIHNWLMETYGISERTAQHDTEWIKKDINRKCERRERAWLNRKTDALLARIEEYENLARIGSDEKANATLLKQRDALEKELDQYTIPNVLAKVKESSTQDPVEFIKAFAASLHTTTEDTIVRDSDLED